MLTMRAAMCFGKGADFPAALAGGLLASDASGVAAVADAATGIEAELTDFAEAGACTPGGTALAVLATLAAGATRAGAPTAGAAGAAPVLAGVRGALLSAAV